MRNGKNRKSFMECFYSFMSDPENLTQEEIRTELEELGVDTNQLETRVAEIVKEGSQKRRLAWVKNAREKRIRIEKMFESKKIARESKSLKTKIKEILNGSYGQDAQSYAKAHFRKIESLPERDLESLIEDMENLNLLEDLNKEEK